MQLTRFLPLLPMPLLPVLAQDCQGPTEICSFAGRHLTSGNLAIEIQQFRNCLGNIWKRYLNKSSLRLTKTYDRLSVELLVTILNLQRTESSKHCNLDSSLTQRGAMCPTFKHGELQRVSLGNDTIAKDHSRETCSSTRKASKLLPRAVRKMNADRC
jgi:hypothetical protein